MAESTQSEQPNADEQGVEATGEERSSTASMGTPVALSGLFIMALLYTVYFAAPILIPITVALLLTLLLDPFVDTLEALYLPRALAAAIVLICLSAFLCMTLLVLAAPAREWLERAPASLYKVERKLRALRQPIEDLQKATEQIQEAANLANTPSKPQQVEIKRPALTDLLLSGTPQILASIGTVVVLLFFLLASGDRFLRKLVAVMPRLTDKKRAVEIVRNIQRDISFYLLTVTLCNIGLGLSLALVLRMLEVPNPWLWGAMATMLNFAPYVGASISLVVLTMVGMLTFDGLGESLRVPAVFGVLTVLVSNVVLPLVLGRRLLLSPVAIFLAIIVWGWLWGVVGALLAVPLLASAKIVCERAERLKAVAEFLTP